MSGVGKHYLETISYDVLLWNRLGSRINAINNTAKFLGEGALTLAQDIISEAMTIGDLDNFTELANSIEPTFQRAIISSFLAQTAVNRLLSVKKGTSFGVESKRGRLTVTDEGVWRSAMIPRDPATSIRLGSGYVTPGTTFEGKWYGLSSDPEIGGLAIIEHFSLNYIQGLVNPTTGEPRVELDILGTS